MYIYIYVYTLYIYIYIYHTYVYIYIYIYVHTYEACHRLAHGLPAQLHDPAEGLEALALQARPRGAPGESSGETTCLTLLVHLTQVVLRSGE